MVGERGITVLKTIANAILVASGPIVAGFGYG